MKHALIVAHPRHQSFTLTIAHAYEVSARERGHDVIVRDLYRIGFDPCLKASELPSPTGFGPADDVKAERTLLTDAQVFAFFYPLWFNSPPAILKGYIDRVFSMGFGFGAWRGGNQPLLKSRKMISFSASGAPTEWMMKTGSWEAVRKLFDDHIAAVCGLEIIDHIHFGGIVANMRTDAIEDCTQSVRDTIARFFPGPDGARRA